MESGRAGGVPRTAPRGKRAGLEVRHEAVNNLIGDYPAAAPKTVAKVAMTSAHRGEIRDWRVKRRLPVFDLLAEYDWTSQGWSTRPPLWEHHGQCSCGGKTFLFSKCAECLRGLAQLPVSRDHQEHEEEGAALADSAGVFSMWESDRGATTRFGSTLWTSSRATLAKVRPAS